MDQDSTFPSEFTHPCGKEENKNIPVMRALTGKLMGKEFVLSGQEYIIGRDSESHIALKEENISRRHAVITKKASEYLLSDLDSKNGIYVNNLRLKQAVLRNGDVFQVGTSVFQFIWNRKGI